ncbi:PAS domain-containing sensor histidine kinase [Rhodocyclus tenuis]|uniref:histidine kinase n=1 Tax=Rhodocyclus tenuis TaxID=1066 RepID=A0A840GDG2_RHOTE|nr:ATP-binding protein [Rhodocyclus tenuis]MBB4246279.1 PAS domain S-box-containing protein [Rhodocyclus tenuis]
MMEVPEKILAADKGHVLTHGSTKACDDYRDLLLELAASFISLPVDEIDDAIDDAQAQVAAISAADHAFILVYDVAAGIAFVKHHWHAAEGSPWALPLIPLADIADWPSRHARGETVAIDDLSTLAASGLGDFLNAGQAKKLIALPLSGKGGCFGCLVFCKAVETAPFATEELQLHGVFARLLAGLHERKRSESSLRESEARFRSLFEQIENIAVQGYNQRREVIFWNKASQNLYGYRAEEALGRRLEDLVIPPPIRDGVVEAITSWARGGAAIPPGDLLLHDKDGKPVPVYSSHVMLRGIAGEPEMYCVDLDLSEQRRAALELDRYRLQLEQLVEQRTRELAVAKDAAEAANQAKTKFLAASSHDLRQPLMAISLFLDALSRTPLNQEQSRLTDHMGRCVRSLGEMLNTLLDIARLDSGAIEANFSVECAGELCRWLDNEFASVFMRKRLRFMLFFPLREVFLLTDIKLLKSILRNLLDNALKFCDHGGVLVGIRRRGKHALIQVWDTGSGIAPENLDLIFGEYYQIGNEERDPEKGVGLGLSIVLRQARLIGAEIRCRSLPGKGSVFEIELPLAENRE